VTFVSTGFVYVAINYRLPPAVHHPTHARDVAKALAWVADNIGRYSGDPERIYAMGHSAGAHLAALVATDESYLKREGYSLKTIKGDILLDVGAYDIP
jgi:arylformamidase